MTQEKIKELDKIISNEYGNTAGLAVIKDGKTVYENYFNGCTSDSRIHVYSVTKSIISLLIGIALDKGHLGSVNQKVLEFFPDYKIKKREKNIQTVTVKNLLTMTAPYKYKLSTPYIRYFTSGDMVKFSLDLLGGKQPPGQFRYTPLIGPDILSGIIAEASGMTVFDFAAENLFRPMGITVERNLRFSSKEEQLAFNKATDISGWHSDKTGANTAGWGLSLSVPDMTKVGQLFLNGGIWDGARIVSPGWLHESSREQSRSDKPALPYGYLWWIIDDAAFAAMGDGGNVIYVDRKRKLVVSIAALFVRNTKDRIGLIKNHIEPLII